jgi:hypothetical protein
MTYTIARNIVQLLYDPSVASVDRLFCEVSIRKALEVATAEEFRIAEDREDQKWLDERQSEYKSRREALLLLIDSDKISRETARKIDKWAADNPYARPINQVMVNDLKIELEKAIAKVTLAFALRNNLHAQDRFGWDYSKNAEDTEYEAMLKSLDSAQKDRDQIKTQLERAVSGFIK